MNRSKRKILLNSLLTSLLAISVCTNLVTYLQIQHLITAHQWVDHTQKVISAINDIWVSILGIQASQRNYILIKDNNELSSYYQKVNYLHNSLKNIRVLIKDNPRQSARLNKLTPLIQKKINQTQQTIEIYKNKGLDTAIEAMKSSNYWLMHAINNISQEMRQEENFLLEMRNQSVIFREKLSDLFLKISSVFSFVCLSLLFLFINRQYRKEEQAQQKQTLIANQLKGIIEGTNDAIAAIDTNYRFITFNEVFKIEFNRLFGETLFPGADLKKLLESLPLELQTLINLYKKALQGRSFSSIEELGDNRLTKNHYEITTSPIRDNQGQIIGAAQILRNVTERLYYERKMNDAHEKLTNTMFEIKRHNASIYRLSLLSSTLQSCLAIEETFEPIAIYCRKILPQTSGILYLAHPSANYMDFAMQWGNHLNRDTIIAPKQCWALRRGQIHRFYNTEDCIACKHVNNDDSFKNCYICIPLQAQNDQVGLLYIEFNEAKQLNAEKFDKLFAKYELIVLTIAETIALSLSNIKLRQTLRIRSIRDPLTGLFNRSYLEESFDRELLRAQRQQSKMAVIMMDLDHFKAVNDNFGHEAGDLVLIEVAKLLLEAIRQSDIVCRYGGEEILVLMLDVRDSHEAYKKTEELRIAINQLKLMHQGQLIPPISASFGISLLPNQGTTQEVLIKKADEALYLSKKNGRNQVTLA